MSVEAHILAALPANPEPSLRWVALCEAWLRDRVEYLHDHENPAVGFQTDEWRTLLPEIMRRHDRGDPGRVRDDCDAWSMTAIDIARRGGFAFEDCRLLIVHSWFGQIVNPHVDFDHMIGALRIEGDWYVVGDTDHIGPYPAKDCAHTLYESHALPLGSESWQRVSDWSEV